MKISIVLLICASACSMWGQQGPKSYTSDRIDVCTEPHGKCIIMAPAPLKCGKYEDFQPAHSEDCSTNLIGCYRNVPDRCVPRIRMVTEEDWQALLARVAKLESKENHERDK